MEGFKWFMSFLLMGTTAFSLAGCSFNVTENGMIYTVEKIRKNFMPGIKENGEQKKVGRTCQTYSVGVGTANTAVTYSFSVDKETGICLE